MDPSVSPSSQTDYLSRLPNELLIQIFEDVYMNWSEGVEAGRTLRTLTKPISKRFLEFQRHGLYRDITIRSWTGPAGPIGLVNAVVGQLSLGSFIVSLHFDITPHRSSKSLHPDCPESGLSTDKLVKFFKSLVSLRRLTIAGCIDPEDSSNLTIYANHRIILLALASMIDNVDVMSVREEWKDNTGIGCDVTVYAPPSVPLPPGILPSTQIAQLHVLPRDDWSGSYRYRDGVHRNGFITFDLGPRNISPLPSTTTSYDTSFPKASESSLASKPRLFASLKLVTFNEYTSEISSPLLVLLHQFPVESLVFSADYTLPISQLIQLVSKSFHIVRIELPLDSRRVGRVGTRVSTVDFDSAFRGIDLETEDIVQDAMPDDWLYPQLPPDFSIDDFERLRTKADEAGVKLIASGLVQAIKVQQAAEENLELLDKLWQEWKKGQKKSKKGGKARKSKK